MGEVIRRTEEGVVKTTQQLLKRKSYDFRDRTPAQLPTPPQQRRRTADVLFFFFRYSIDAIQAYQRINIFITRFLDQGA